VIIVAILNNGNREDEKTYMADMINGKTPRKTYNIKSTDAKPNWITGMMRLTMRYNEENIDSKMTMRKYLGYFSSSI